MSPRMLRAGMAATAAVALLVAACAGDDSDSEVIPDKVPEAGGDEASAVDAADVIEDEAALQAILDQWRTEVDTFGATLSIRVPGHHDIDLASGVDDRDPETPMPTDGTYQIVSITRTFVTAAALQLVNEGRVSLDEPVEPWLPEIPNADEITLAMLLDNTSGIGEWYGANASASAEQDYGATLLGGLTRSFTPAEVLAKHLEQPPLGQPGEGFAWSHASFHAVGLLIERELDQDLAAVIEERFAGPLALKDTALDDGSTPPTRHGWFAIDDDPDLPLDVPEVERTGASTANWAGRGAMLSSSADMLDWGEALYSGEVLGEDSTATMLEMRNAFSLPTSNDDEDAGHWKGLPGDGPFHYGLGVMGFCPDQTSCGADEIEVVGHWGGWLGSQALLAHHRDSGTTMIVHLNADVAEPPQTFALVADALQQLGLT